MERANIIISEYLKLIFVVPDGVTNTMLTKKM